MFEDIFKLLQLYALEKLTPNKPDESNWKTLLLMYEELGPSGMAKLVSLAKGKAITFPTEEEFQDSVITTLSYYYKEVENKNWDEIKKILNQPDLNTIKFGIRVRNFSTFINEQLLKKFKKVEI